MARLRRATATMKGDSMRAQRLVSALVLCVALSAASGCASFQTRDPLQVTVAGIEPLQGQGMELRLLVRLRVQNPNDAPIDYNGVAVEMIVQGKTFATGVSAAHGNIPRFGEALVEVPVTASAFRMMGQALGLMKSGGIDKIAYEMKGKLNVSALNSVHFQTKGDFELPTGADSAESGT